MSVTGEITKDGCHKRLSNREEKHVGGVQTKASRDFKIIPSLRKTKVLPLFRMVAVLLRPSIKKRKNVEEAIMRQTCNCFGMPPTRQLQRVPRYHLCKRCDRPALRTE